MLRNRLNNRIRDEMDVDSSEHSDDGDYSADSDDDHEYLPENNENNCDSDDSDASETTEIENVEQEVLEHLAVHPEDGIRSKDKTILYSKEPFDANRRNSGRRSPNINPGIVFIQHLVVCLMKNKYLLFLLDCECFYMNVFCFQVQKQLHVLMLILVCQHFCYLSSQLKILF